MTNDTTYLSRVNSVTIFKTASDVAQYEQMLRNLAESAGDQIISFSCKDCLDEQSGPVVSCIVNRVLEEILRASQPGCAHPELWIKARRSNAGFSEIVRIAAGLTTLEQLGTMLAHESPKIKDQVQVMLAIEQRRVVFLVLSDFHAIPSEEQPVIAGLLHRFSKNLPVYLRILSLSELVLFRRDSTGEAGMQRDHDYVEFRQS